MPDARREAGKALKADRDATRGSGLLKRARRVVKFLRLSDSRSKWNNYLFVTQVFVLSGEWQCCVMHCNLVLEFGTFGIGELSHKHDCPHPALHPAPRTCGSPLQSSRRARTSLTFVAIVLKSSTQSLIDALSTDLAMEKTEREDGNPARPAFSALDEAQLCLWGT